VAIRSKNIPAAVHLPAMNQKVSIVPVPIPILILRLLPGSDQKSKNLLPLPLPILILRLLPGPDQKSKNLPLALILLNLRPPGDPQVPGQ